MHNTLIILAGGASSRMKRSMTTNLTEDEIYQANIRTKGLISIDPEGRPLMDYLLFNAKNAGYRNIIIVISPSNDAIKEFYGAKDSCNMFHGLTISYAVQQLPKNREKPLGTADAVFQTLEQYPELQDDLFTVCNSDNLYSVESLKTIRKFQEYNGLIAYNKDALEFSSERISRFAVLNIEDKLLKGIIEKPENNELNNFKDEKGILRISMNIFKFYGKDIYTYLKNCPLHPTRNEKEIPTALTNFINNGGKVKTIPMSEYVPDLTSKEDISKMKSFIAKNYGQLNWSN